MDDNLTIWRDGAPAVAAGITTSGDLSVWKDGAPVVMEEQTPSSITFRNTTLRNVTIGGDVWPPSP